MVGGVFMTVAKKNGVALRIPRVVLASPKTSIRMSSATITPVFGAEGRVTCDLIPRGALISVA